MMRFLAGAVLLVSLAANTAPAAPLLPGSFGGWTVLPGKDSMQSPAPETSAALEEYGLVQRASATYYKGSADLTVSVWQFKDATGAYGAFTFLLQPKMHAEKIGSGGAAEGGHFLVWRGGTVVSAEFSHPASGDKASLDALAAQLPGVAGGASVAPSLPRYLPPRGLDPESVRYAIGPVAYRQAGGVLPPDMIGFSDEAEAVTAKYGPANAEATLTLILYPTPQIAASHLKAIDGLAKTRGLMTKRSGPLLAVVSRNDEQAKRLLSAVRFKDLVIMNRPEGYVNEAAKVAQLLLGIATLTGILIGGAVLVALFLGGGRAMLRRIQGKPVSSVNDEEFISLNLRR